MVGPRLCALWLSVAAVVSVVSVTHAITPVAAKEYGLQVTHTERSRIALDAGAHGLELTLTITNGGTHNLSDVRVYVVRAGSSAITDRSEPARIAKLAAGATTVLTWVFDPKQPLSGPLQDVVLRVEAIDQVSREIVTFSQKSREVR